MVSVVQTVFSLYVVFEEDVHHSTKVSRFLREAPVAFLYVLGILGTVPRWFKWFLFWMSASLQHVNVSMVLKEALKAV